jgi:hypothetical protein
MRLRIREAFLDRHSDETLESGDVELDDLAPGDRRAFMAYLLLATIQDLVIQHLESSILGE